MTSFAAILNEQKAHFVKCHIKEIAKTTKDAGIEVSGIEMVFFVCMIFSLCLSDMKMETKENLIISQNDRLF